MSKFYFLPLYNMVYSLNVYPVGQFNFGPYNYYSQQPFRQYTDVDATLFEQSAKSMQVLMKEANLILNQLAESKTFANNVLHAAQHSNMKEVDMLIKSTGIKSKVVTSLNPDGIHLKLSSKEGDADYCHLTIPRRWM